MAAHKKRVQHGDASQNRRLRQMLTQDKNQRMKSADAARTASLEYSAAAKPAARRMLAFAPQTPHQCPKALRQSLRHVYFDAKVMSFGMLVSN